MWRRSPQETAALNMLALTRLQYSFCFMFHSFWENGDLLKLIGFDEWDHFWPQRTFEKVNLSCLKVVVVGSDSPISELTLRFEASK